MLDVEGTGIQAKSYHHAWENRIWRVYGGWIVMILAAFLLRMRQVRVKVVESDAKNIR